MAAPRRKYTNEMKLNAVHLVQNEGRRACDVADELGIDRNTLYAWLRDARNGKLSTDDPAREVTPEQAEISRLRAELARSRQECALLKKIRGVPQHDRPQVRYAFIREILVDPELHGKPLSERCRILSVSTSGYYEWLGRQEGRP